MDYYIGSYSANRAELDMSLAKFSAAAKAAALTVLLCLFFCSHDTMALSTPNTGGIVKQCKHFHESLYSHNNRDSFASFVTMRTGIDLESARLLVNDNNMIPTTSDRAEKDDRDNRQSVKKEKSPGSSDVVFWMGEGQLYESPSGKMIAKVEGFDASRGVYINDHHIRQFSRKIFWFRDPETNELITEYKGKPVRPIRYDWQVFDFQRGTAQGGDPSMVPILPTVLKGPRSVPCMPVTPRYAGKDVILFQCPLFINIETANGPYQAWEIYDYTLDLSHDANRPPSLSWSRQGSNPPFLENGNGVMHFLGHRLDSFEELPRHVKTLVEEEYSLFRAPPLNMEEIHELEAEMFLKKKGVRRCGDGSNSRRSSSSSNSSSISSCCSQTVTSSPNTVHGKTRLT